MKLVEIAEDSKPPDNCHEIHSLTLGYYQVIGFAPPWASYYLQDGEEVVGVCSFKGKPDDNNKVEIAYHTFEPYENRGYGSKMCELLKAIAANYEGIIVSARTLPEENASTAILGKNGFKCVGIVIDPDDGEVWEWILD